MSVAERKRGGPTGNRAESAIKRAKIIEMRMAGASLERIGEEIGLSHEGVRYHQQAWLAEQTPSAEQTEELRQLQAAQIDALTAKLWPMLATEDYLAVNDRIVKLMDRKARLMGLDLERNVNISVLPTAEQFARFLGWDDQETPAIEGNAVEITDG
jgi:hypothetical protein